MRSTEQWAGLDYPDDRRALHLGCALNSAPARVVEHVLIQQTGHNFSLRENRGQGWIIPTIVGLYILTALSTALPRGWSNTFSSSRQVITFSLRENRGQGWIRASEGVSQRINSPPRNRVTLTLLPLNCQLAQ
jgi:hypothetical protein